MFFDKNDKNKFKTFNRFINIIFLLNKINY